MESIDFINHRLDREDNTNLLAYHQAKATLAVAEQLKRIADLMESEACRKDALADAGYDATGRPLT